ncbi:hypothetical protein OUZ56_012109 [Daphnia magna]|uniref:Uncharacterized protein n=1 Tax=Daphnia magna TaxID=35525 RepID=A0ABQ9Z3E7_9CRUS|nr:hypothetical protein OUZ56_012109 [Daphnia magna]
MISKELADNNQECQELQSKSENCFPEAKVSPLGLSKEESNCPSSSRLGGKNRGLGCIYLRLKASKANAITVQGSKYPTLSLVVPLYNRLLNLLEEALQDYSKHPLLVKGAIAGLRKLANYYGKTHPIVLDATYADPRSQKNSIRQTAFSRIPVPVGWFDNESDTENKIPDPNRLVGIAILLAQPTLNLHRTNLPTSCTYPGEAILTSMVGRVLTSANRKKEVDRT